MYTYKIYITGREEPTVVTVDNPNKLAKQVYQLFGKVEYTAEKLK